MRRSRGIINGWPIAAGGYAVITAAPTPGPTLDNTLAGDTSFLSGNPVWASRFRALEQRFTALGEA